MEIETWICGQCGGVGRHEDIDVSPDGPESCPVWDLNLVLDGLAILQDDHDDLWTDLGGES